MTDSNDPTRRRPHREPATLDLKATVVDDGRSPAAPVAPSPSGEEPASPTSVIVSPAPAGETPDGGEEASTSPAAETAAAHGSAQADESAVANEGPSESAFPGSGAVGAEGGGGRADEDGPRAEASGAEPSGDRDAVDPTVPVSDPDFTPPRAGSVPPVAAAGSAANAEPLASPAGAAGSRRHGEPPRRGAGFGSLLTAGILGGLVGAGALYGLQTFRPAQAPEDPRIAEIQQRLAALPRSDAAQGLERRLGAVETAQADLGQRVGAAQSLAERAAARAEEAANRPASAASGAPAAGTPAPAPVADPAAFNDLTSRLAALEAQTRNPPPAPVELDNRLGALERQIGERVQANAGATQALERQVAEAAAARQDLERRITEAANAAQAVERRAGENGQRLGELQRQLQQWSPQAVQAGLRAVLAGRLNEALAQGVPFADVLGALARFEADPARLRALEPLAASGAPTAAALQQEFRPLAERIARDTRGEADTLTERLLRMADRVVTVRAVDDPGSNAVPAVLARIENALARGALADAAAAWDALPEPARQASAAWGQRLKARVAAEDAARAVAADSIAAINTAPR